MSGCQGSGFVHGTLSPLAWLVPWHIVTFLPCQHLSLATQLSGSVLSLNSLRATQRVQVPKGMAQLCPLLPLLSVQHVWNIGGDLKEILF